MAQSSLSACHMTFSEFLDSSASIQPHVVVGNEAGDADSIVSALSLAYVDSVFNNSPKTPIISIPRADMPLRRETVLLLQLASVDVDKLHYIDDNDVWKGVTSITLVDHNRLTLKLKNVDAKVVEILDHHFDEGSHANVQGEFRNVAFENGKATVASTCTLIAERFVQTKTAIPPYNAQLSLVLLGVILLDTVNMSPQAGKGTVRDQSAIDILTKNTDWSTLEANEIMTTNEAGTTTIDTNKLFQVLSESKYDVDFWKGLSVLDALRLDYKRFQASNGKVFGASTVLLDLDSFSSKENVVEQILLYMKQANVPLLAVLSSAFRNGTAQRELLLCGNDKELVDKMSSFLVTNPKASVMQAKEEPLGFEYNHVDNGLLVMRRFHQGNPKASRKQVAPILMSFYEHTGSASSLL